MTEKDESNPKNIFETLLRGISIKFNPDNSSLTVKLPSIPTPVVDEQHQSRDTPSNGDINDTDETQDNKVKSLEKELTSETEIEFVDIDYETNDLDVDLDMESEVEPVRVKIHLKAYIKLALHALKYANPKRSQKDWLEVIGLLTGYIENKDTPLTCLVIKNAFPIGHGTDVNAQIRDPQSHVRVYKELKGEMIIGWYHSHPSYGVFMSNTDYRTQVRYQKLGTRGSQLTAPIALVIDPTKISKRSYGFKIFRLETNLKEWEEPRYEVLNSHLESLPEMMETLLPLAENKAMFLEYDHE
ncbi:MAG: hypothetical protein ACXAEU_10180 [Candidatus Hodarchaeales archaeon]